MIRYRRISSHDAAQDLVSEDVRVREIDDSQVEESGFLYMRVECKGVQYFIHVDARFGICREVRA